MINLSTALEETFVWSSAVETLIIISIKFELVLKVYNTCKNKQTIEIIY